MKTKDIIQQEGLTAWKLAGKKGTLFITTGIGKTKIFLDAVKEFPETAKILFLAETTSRETDLKEEMNKWDCKHKIDFLCYQSAYKLQGQYYDFVCADEIDTALTPVYSAFFFNNTYSAIIGLTATIDKGTKVAENQEITKEELLNKFAPVCYRYTASQGQIDGTSRRLEIYVISHKLDSVNKTVKAGSKLKSFMTTEQAAYDYWDKQFKQSLFLPEGDKKTFRIRITSAARAKLLYNLPSLIEETKKLVAGLDGRTLLFGNSLDALLKVTPDVISSKNSDAKNDLIREEFENDKIQLLGSFKKLERGANLPDLDNCVLMSYYSKERIAVQRLGRMRQNGIVGRVFIFVVEFTQSVKWLHKMLAEFSGFTVTKVNSVNDCLSHLTSKTISYDSQNV